MKRKRLDRDVWTDITKKQYLQKQLCTPQFTGLAAFLLMEQVERMSVWEMAGIPMTVCASGVQWMQLIPDGAPFMITAMLDGDGVTQGWYIDVIAGWGIDATGIAYMDDLYADVIVSPEGAVKVDDLDELDAARDAGEITAAQHTAALAAVELLLCDYTDPAVLETLTRHTLNAFWTVSPDGNVKPHD